MFENLNTQLPFDQYQPRLEDWLPYMPAGNVRWRHSYLHGEMEKLWNAQSFMTWRFGVYFNAHITILAQPLGIIDHREFAGLMAPFNKEMKRWLAVSGESRRRRWCKRVVADEPQEHLWLYTFEHSVRRGLHAHQLCVVPKKQRKAFEAHVRDWWSRAACLDVHPTAIHVTYRPSAAMTGLTRHAEWFRYVVKSARRDSGFYDNDGQPCLYHELFKLRPHPKTMPVYVPQMAGICRALSAKAQKTPILVGPREYRFASKITSGDFDRLFDGSEFEEYWRREQHAYADRLQRALQI